MDLLEQTDQVFFGSTGLDKNQTMEIVANCLHGADDGDLFLEMRHSEMLSFDDGRLKTATYDQSAGFGLRAIVGEADAFAHAGELSEAALRRAAETVSAVASGHSGQLAIAPEAGRNQSLYSDANPLNQTAFEDKVELLQKIDSYARAKDPRVKQVSASIAGSWQAVQIIRPDGTRYADIRPLVRLNVAVVAEKTVAWKAAPAGLADGLCLPAIWMIAYGRQR